MRDEPVTDAELRASRDFLIGVFPLRFETPGPVVGSIAGLVVHDLPDDELARYRDGIEAVERRRRPDGRPGPPPPGAGRDRPGRRCRAHRGRRRGGRLRAVRDRSRRGGRAGLKPFRGLPSQVGKKPVDRPVPTWRHKTPMDRNRIIRAAGGTLVAAFLVASAVIGADALTRPASPANPVLVNNETTRRPRRPPRRPRPRGRPRRPRRRRRPRHRRRPRRPRPPRRHETTHAPRTTEDPDEDDGRRQRQGRRRVR